MQEDFFQETEDLIEALPTTGPSLLYVLYAEGTSFIKIGYTENVTARIAQLQSGCPQRLCLLFATACEDAPALERLMHDHFAPYRMHGEWFALPPEPPTILGLLAFLYSHSRPAHPPLSGDLEDVPMDSENRRTRILASLTTNRPMSIREIMQTAAIPESNYVRFRQMLSRMVKQGVIRKYDHGLYCARAPQATGEAL